MKVLVTGAAGQLGAAIVNQFRKHAVVVALGHADLELTDRTAIESRIRAESPDVVINCAAYNQVDAAEDDPVSALKVNMLAVGSLAHAAASAGAVFIHYSTDFVFDGQSERPYTEADRTNPRSVYGMSKLLGEWLAADAPRHYVLRVESLFGAAPGGVKRGSAATICQRIVADEEVVVFVDRTVSPTHVVDAAIATERIVADGLPYGVYHCVNSGNCTWKELAEAAATMMGKPARLRPVTLASVSLKAERPKYCALSNARLAGYGVVLPDWRDALQRSLDE